MKEVYALVSMYTDVHGTETIHIAGVFYTREKGEEQARSEKELLLASGTYKDCTCLVVRTHIDEED